MRERIVLALWEARTEGGALPSVRALARTFGASPQTVQKALCDLAARGALHIVPRKGAYWGREPTKPDASALERPAPSDGLRERLLVDLRRGVFHPHRELPPRKALAQIYGTSARRMGAIVDGLASQGILERRGRALQLPAPPVRASQGLLLVVVRCDAAGRILLESEREVDFLKSVRREALEQDLRVLVAGYHEGARPGALLDEQGRAFRPDRAGGILLGCLVSTWLVGDPQAMLARLRSLRVPLSVWWEHPVDTFPERARRGSAIAGFNLSFGSAPGIAVGRRLAAEGFRRIAYISPFHGNEWSRARLQGLREALGPHGGEVRPFVDERYHSEWHLGRMAGGARGARALMRRTLSSWLADPALADHPAWVVVNDAATVELLELLRAKGIARPRLVSFDSTSASEALRFDSFEFQTDGMVRRMLHHVFHPAARLFERQPVEEMLGRLVVRG